jgi:hypothetical protein
VSPHKNKNEKPNRKTEVGEGCEERHQDSSHLPGKNTQRYTSANIDSKQIRQPSEQLSTLPRKKKTQG